MSVIMFWPMVSKYPSVISLGYKHQPSFNVCESLSLPISIAREKSELVGVAYRQKKMRDLQKWQQYI